jgi:hypothetical protein
LSLARGSHGQQDNRYKKWFHSSALFPSLSLLSTELSCAKAHSRAADRLRTENGMIFTRSSKAAFKTVNARAASFDGASHFIAPSKKRRAKPLSELYIRQAKSLP